MSIQREDVKNFSELDAETRVTLLIEYIKVLREGYISNSTKTLENTDVNVALAKAYKLLEKEFEK
jgi:hypothetical protein